MSSQTAKEISVTALLPESDARDLERLAKEADRSRAAELRRAVRVYLENEKAAA